MGMLVHCREKKDGTVVFRAYSTISDQYETEEMSEEEIKEWLLNRAIERAKIEHEKDFPGIVLMAKSKGTSDHYAKKGSLKKPWSKERE